MALGHTLSWCITPVAGVLGYVIRPHNPFALERRGENIGIAWHRKFRERFDGRSRQGIEHIALALFVEHVIEKRAEFRTGKFDAGVRHDLHKTMDVGLCGYCRASAIKYLQRSPFFAC